MYIVLLQGMKLIQQPNVAGLLQVVDSFSCIDLNSWVYNSAVCCSRARAAPGLTEGKKQSSKITNNMKVKMSFCPFVVYFLLFIVINVAVKSQMSSNSNSNGKLLFSNNNLWMILEFRGMIRKLKYPFTEGRLVLTSMLTCEVLAGF